VNSVDHRSRRMSSLDEAKTAGYLETFDAEIVPVGQA
jgi:hypothetical protein